WFALDATLRSAAARRLDGRVWMPGTKAVFLPGSQAGWALGAAQLTDIRHVLLVEGGPDLLAAHHFIAAAGREDVAVVAMLTASCALPPEAVAGLTGRVVTIIPHADASGQAAGRRWAGQLNQAAAAVRGLSLAGIHRPDGAPIKDLCHLAAAFAAGHPAAAERAASLFQP
ncbi:MAG TPA: hypothetical protein PKE47_03275, partial [Verrucomicrobiota bacterium]|nr:hypothetical protein [Verrucomicrobiota bacterium]